MLALFAADQPEDRILGPSLNAQLLDRPVAGFGPFHGRRPVGAHSIFGSGDTAARKRLFPG